VQGSIAYEEKIRMRSDISKMKRKTKRGVRWWRRVALPLLAALLVLLVADAHPAAAGSSAPLRPATPATVSRQQADAAPALIAYNGTLYVGWTGRNTGHNLNLMTYNPASQSFGPAVVLTDATQPGSGLGLAVYNGNLYVAWRGGDNHLNVARYNPATPTHLANKVTLRDSSNQAPSIAVYNGSLYLSWRGMDGHLNLLSSADASTFGSKVVYGAVTASSPALVVANGYLFVSWVDAASSSLKIGRYTPASPGTMSAVVTLAATSQRPVGLAPAAVANPYVSVAWRIANAHINLGIYKGSSSLSNAVTTVQSTPYGPALALFSGSAYISWVGTDSAQSVNVSAVNLPAPITVVGYPLYTGNTQLPEIALCFDDGPTPPYTSQILNILQSYGIHATFFVIGEQVPNNSALVLQEFRGGNAIGNHTWSHPSLIHLTAAQVRAELLSTSQEIATITGQAPIVFRPPGGEFNSTVQSIAANLGLSTVLWNVDPKDWSLPGTNVIIQRVLAATHNGSIILLHDGGGNRSQTVAALSTIISTLQQRGFRFVTLPQMIQDLGPYATHPAAPAPTHLDPE
jgi:peptidoglycan/xylan/chitin deacetylase (PgdA/CDA1 family)